MAGDIIEGYELDLPHSEHKIHVKHLPYGNYVVIETGGLTIKVRGGSTEEGQRPLVEVVTTPVDLLTFSAYHLDEGDTLKVFVRPTKGPGR